MSVSEMLEHLDRAMAEIQLVEEQLNDTAHSCATCGFDRRENFTQYVTRAQLSATRTKIRRIAGALLSDSAGLAASRPAG